jgi:methyl-accepting chemotaxis protein
VKIRPKILLGFAVPTSAALAVSVLLFQAFTHGLTASDWVRHTEQVIANANALRSAAVDAAAGQRGYVITGQDAFLTEFNDGNAGFDTIAPQLRGLVSDNSPQAARVDEIVRLHRDWLDRAATPTMTARRTSGFAAAQRLVATGTGRTTLDQIRAVTDQLTSTESDLLTVRTAANNAAARNARRLTVFGFAILLLLELGSAAFLSRRLAGSAQAVTEAARALAAGDTTIRADIRGSDEIGELAAAFNDMADQLVAAAQAERDSSTALQAAVTEYTAFAAKVADGDLTGTVSANGSAELRLLSANLTGMASGLADLSGQVREGAQQIGTGTAQILATVSEHTATASEQSAAISETSSTADEVRAASEQTASKAREVADSARASVEISEQGTEAVEAIGVAMEQIRQRVDAIARDILALSQQGQQIADIIATVNDVADQSNILALNAGIEAAKAGEHGKGFAVVATEVRNLAEQSKQATAQVRAILGEVQQATAGAVAATEHGTKVVEEGQRLAVRAGDVIRSQADTIRSAAHAAQQIAASAHQQSIGMDQVALAMKNLSESTGQFVTGARQSQLAAEDLNRLAHQLTSMTDRYRT